MSTRKRKQEAEEEEELQSLPSDESEEEEEYAARFLTSLSLVVSIVQYSWERSIRLRYIALALVHS